MGRRPKLSAAGGSGPRGVLVPSEDTGFLRSYRRIVMYEDLNSAGTIFGGKLASWIDEGSAIFAVCQMNARRIVTVKISELVFNQPAKLGDILEIWCKAVRKGRTSITIQTLVTRRSFTDVPNSSPESAVNDYERKPESEICRCELVFVCVDEKGRPRAWHKAP